DIDYAIKWYEIKSSQFSKLATFYGQKGWFDRQVLHGEVVAGAIVLGFAVHALAFFAVVGAYYKLSEILSDHYNIEEANKEAIRKSFDGLREELKQSIETFNEMERKLDEAFTALEEQTASLSTTIAQLGVEAGKLHSQVTRLEGMVKQLQEQQEKMLATTGKLNDAGEKLSQEIESLSSIIIEKKATIDLVSETIVSVVKSSLEVEKANIDDSFNATHLLERTTKQAEVIQGHTEKFKHIESEHDSKKEALSHSNEVMLLLKEKRSASANSSQETKELIQKSQSIHERARRAIALKQKASHGRDEENSQVRSASPALS
ncbi:Chromosome partition protein Smc, partial [Legionella feeleii]